MKKGLSCIFLCIIFLCDFCNLLQEVMRGSWDKVITEEVPTHHVDTMKLFELIEMEDSVLLWQKLKRMVHIWTLMEWLSNLWVRSKVISFYIVDSYFWSWTKNELIFLNRNNEGVKIYKILDAQEDKSTF